MSEPTIPRPSEEELHDLRRDAQEGVAGARAALGGNSAALNEWRRKQNKVA